MIKDSVYVVTGGASGLGEGAANVLLTEGAYVTILDLQLPSKASPLRVYGDKVLFLQVDVTSEKDVLNALDATKRKFGKLNGLINAAGIKLELPVYNFDTKTSHSLQEFTKVIDVNLVGPFNVLRLAIPLIIENEPNADGERGIIINTTSILGNQGVSSFVAYSASKAGLQGITYPLAKELSSHGIRVLDIAPGLMDTPMAVDFPQEEVTKTLVFPKRMGKPSEFGHLVKSIIENPLLNGTSIRLDCASRPS